MTDNEIIKALECCAEDEWRCNNNCPFFEKCSKTLMAKSSLDIITRQQAEIERLKAHINEVADKVEDKMTYMSGCQNLIQIVKKIILGDKTPSESLCDNCGLCKEREEEAVKEFAERLKNTYFIDSERLCYQVDKVLKEMVGEME